MIPVGGVPSTTHPRWISRWLSWWSRSPSPSFAENRRYQGFGAQAFRAFESAQIETRSFRLAEPQYHHLPAFLATRTLDNVHEHCVSPIGSCTIGRALRKSRVLNVTDVWQSAGAITKRFFGKSTLHNVASFKTQSSAKSFGVHTVTLGDLLYAIQTCNLRSCRYVALRLDTHCVCSKPTRARRVQ